MQIAQILSGYSLGEADLLRRAMGKKIKSEMDAQKERFVAGAEAKGVEPAQADYIFELVAKFAGYGFNKSHAACYGIVAYQTAYLKANHPVEFLAASMTLDLGNTDKLQVFRRETQRLKVAIRPPEVNSSGVEFLVRDGDILYSLAALKNVGRAAVEHVETVRRDGPFAGLADFARRVDPRILTKRALESMAKAGAFDGLHRNRAEVLAGVEAILATASRTSSEIEAGQVDLFMASGGPAEALPLPKLPAWTPMERLGHEFDAVGFYLSGHPLDDYMPLLARLGAESYAHFREKALKGAEAARLIGTVTYRQERRSSRSGNRFAFIGFSDPTGQFEAVCFADTLAGCRDLLEVGKALILRIEADVDGEDVKLRLQGVEPLEEISAGLSAGLTIYLAGPTVLESVAARLTNRGRSPVHLVLPLENGREARIGLGNRFTVTPALKGAIKAIPGVEAVEDL